MVSYLFAKLKKNQEEKNTMENHDHKTERVLSMYKRLKEGGVVSKAEESRSYHVAERTIQRDLSDIQYFLSRQESETGEVQQLVFDRNAGGYRLETKLQKHLTKEELLLVCQMMSTCAFLEEQEKNSIISRLLNLCAVEMERGWIRGRLESGIDARER